MKIGRYLLINKQEKLLLNRNDKQTDNKYHIRRIDTSIIEEHKKKRDNLIKEINKVRS